MRITGVKSICCSKSVKTAPIKKREKDKMFICLECGKLCEHFYVAEIEYGEAMMPEKGR